MRTRFALVFIALVISLNARADLTIVSDVNSATPSAVGNFSTMTMKLAAGKVRVETGPAHVVILPTEKKMYVIMDAQRMCMVKSLNSAVPKASSAGEKPTVQRTGKTETISGYPCEQILLKDKQGRVTEIWASEMAPDMKEFVPTFDLLAELNPKKSEYEWTGMMTEKGLNTYPIRLIRYGIDGKEESRVTVTSISKEPIPASDFSKPNGYLEMQMPDLGGFGGSNHGDHTSRPALPTGGGNSLEKIQEMQKKMQSGTQPSRAEIEETVRQLQRNLQTK